MLAVPYPTSFYEPNQGIYPGMTPPPSLDTRFPDVDSPLPVYLIVSPHPSPSAPNPRTRPWSIAWPLAMSSSLVPALLPAPDASFAPVALPVPSESIQHGKLHRVVAVARVLEASRERSRDNFTFWGPLTRPWSKPDMLGTRWVLIGVLDRPTRRALERLADRVRLMKPNGWWNGQNWVVALLNAAVDEGVLSFTQRDAALLTAAFI